MGQQLQLFEADLPYKPYCTDDLSVGLRIGYKQKALTKRYIQHNPPARVKWLVFDCDYVDSLGAVESRNLPHPNIVAINRQNGHSHVFYGLDVGVVRTDQGRVKPLQYLASVEFALCEALTADPNYSGLVSKNPLHDHWLVYEGRQTLYDLGELAEYLTLPKRLPKRAEVRGLGRNCTLFELGRKWAYREVLAYRLTGNQTGFKASVLSALLSLNSFPEPLQAREVEGIAKSIAKWTWKHYTGRLPDDQWQAYVKATHTPEIQSKRGKKGGKAGGRGRATSDLEKRLQAVSMRSEGHTQQAIAQALGVGQSTVHRWLKS
ncbi:replication initiation protein [Burkholderia vietnamiensis]|uniref:replication initiation protein n=1 Tax=Burkholderia vietnamiensis TaxID=60552 RepID=UPI0015940F8D|nr:replication initiation protein [Burkholderia vietnamiensis]